MKRLVCSPYIVFGILMILLVGCTSNKVHIASDGSGDFATLEEAIGIVSPDATIILGEGQFELSERLVIENTVTIQGAGIDLTTILNSSGGSPVFLFKGEKLTLTDISIERTGKYASNIMIIDGGEVYVENCKISGGTASQDGSIQGAGLWITGDSSVTIKNCTFEDNMGAGIVLSDNANVSADNIISSNNLAGIAFIDNSVGDIQNSTFFDNQDAGIYVLDSAQVNIIDNNILNNAGPGIYYKSVAPNGEVSNNRLSGNDTGTGGAGTDIMIRDSHALSLIGNTCDGKGENLFGVDFNGIVFISRGSIPTNTTLEGNSCSVAECTSPTGTLLSLECK